MLLKKSTIALCSSNNLAPFWLPSSITSSCGGRGSSRRLQRPLRQDWLRAQDYATVYDGNSRVTGGYHNQNPHHNWPRCANPTPYEIFGQQKGTPYSKKTFYELVKIYHPDRHHHNRSDDIPHTVKLERYRLIVAANKILSDPAKRRAYDLYGAGWGGESDMQNSYRNADRAWRQEPGNASMNATWEDWEQWYQQRDGQKQAPVYMSNGGFAAVLLAFIFIGSWGQATRAGTSSMSVLSMRDEKHDAISKDMRRRQSANAGLSREDRVESFLRQREGWGYDRSSAQGHLAQNSAPK